jgi:hypothetical protein
MNDLAAALGHVRDQIAKHRGEAIGEENTKHALIEPVLKALGWDVADLDEVRCEYKLKQGDNPVDYALFVHGNLRLFVEAKALGENLDKWASQIMGYAGVAGVVEWIALTDGNEYRIYNAHAQVPVTQKLFKRAVIASDDPDVPATLLLLSKAQLQGTVIDDLWRQYFVDRQVKAAVEGLAGLEPATDFLRLIHKRVPALSLTDVRQSLGRATLSLDYRGAQSAPIEPLGPKTAPPSPVAPIVGPSGQSQATSESGKEVDRDVVLLGFWTKFLDVAAAQGLVKHGRTATTANWMDNREGPIDWSWTIREHNALAVLYVDGYAVVGNYAYLRRLQDFKTDIEAAYGGPLEWDLVDGRKHQKVMGLVSAGGYRDEERWPAVIEAMLRAMTRLEAACRPYLDRAADAATTAK